MNNAVEWKGIPLLVLMLLLTAGTAWAQGLTCGQCGAVGQPELSLACNRCGHDLHSYKNRLKARSSAVLVVEIQYTGNSPDRLPEYGKLYLNRKYRGNIPLVEKEARDMTQAFSSRRGLGFDYTGVYRHEIRDLDPGLYQVQMEMLFVRFAGIMKSFRRVVFPRVHLKAGEKTVIRHTFSGPRDFPDVKRSRPETGQGGGPDLKTATGTVGLEVPVF